MPPAASTPEPPRNRMRSTAGPALPVGACVAGLLVGLMACVPQYLLRQETLATSQIVQAAAPLLPPSSRDSTTNPTLRNHPVDWARRLLAAELDRSWAKEASATTGLASRKSTVRRLETAQNLAAQTLARRPRSWQAAMVVGAAIHLERKRAESPKLLTHFGHWQQPLEHSLDWAPTQVEPLRYLLAAYLDAWPFLSTEKKAETKLRLQTAFNNPQTFRLLSPAWMEIAESDQEAWSLVPLTTRAWGLLRQRYASSQDWQRLQEAHRRYEEASIAEFEAAVHEAQLRQNGGDTRGAQRLFEQAFLKTAPDADALALLEKLQAFEPPSTSDPLEAHARNWLKVLLAQASIDASHLPLPVARSLCALTGLTHWRAASLLLSGESPSEQAHPESSEGRSEALEEFRSDPVLWQNYNLLAIRRRLEQGQPLSALAIYQELPAKTQQSPTGQRLAAELHAITQALPPGQQGAASSYPTSTREWIESDGRAAQVVWIPAGGAECRIDVTRTPKRGSLVEVLLDRQAIDQFVLEGPTTLRLSVAAQSEGPRLLELVELVKGPIRAGRLEIGQPLPESRDEFSEPNTSEQISTEARRSGSG